MMVARRLPVGPEPGTRSAGVWPMPSRTMRSPRTARSTALREAGGAGADLGGTALEAKASRAAWRSSADIANTGWNANRHWERQATQSGSNRSDSVRKSRATGSRNSRDTQSYTSLVRQFRSTSCRRVAAALNDGDEACAAQDSDGYHCQALCDNRRQEIISPGTMIS